MKIPVILCAVMLSGPVLAQQQGVIGEAQIFVSDPADCATGQHVTGLNTTATSACTSFTTTNYAVIGGHESDGVTTTHFIGTFGSRMPASGLINTPLHLGGCSLKGMAAKVRNTVTGTRIWRVELLDHGVPIPGATCDITSSSPCGRTCCSTAVTYTFPAGNPRLIEARFTRINAAGNTGGSSWSATICCGSGC